jgi:hypothetical protein
VKKLNHYRATLRNVLSEYEALGVQDAFEPITTHFACDDERAEYLMLNVGHDTTWNRWIHAILFHAWIRDGKVWVACDNISPSVVRELIAKGIPATDIVPASEQPFEREQPAAVPGFSG